MSLKKELKKNKGGSMKKWIVGFVAGLMFFTASVASAIRLPEVPEYRMIYITEISMVTAIEITTRLSYLDKTKGDIRIILTTPGGQIVAGLMIIDAMNRCNNDVQTYANGAAYSMGTYILSSGAEGKRVINKHGSTLIHHARLNYTFRSVTVNDLQEDIKLMKIYEDILNTILSETTGFSVDAIKSVTEDNGVLTRERTINLNIVDGVYEGDL